MFKTYKEVRNIFLSLNTIFLEYKVTLIMLFATQATLFCKQFLYFRFKTKPIHIFS